MDKDVEKIINHFNSNVLVRFSPSGYGHTLPSLSEKLSELTGIAQSKVERVMAELERFNVLKEEKGLHSPGGSEYEYGFTPFAKSKIGKHD